MKKRFSKILSVLLLVTSAFAQDIIAQKEGDGPEGHTNPICQGRSTLPRPEIRVYWWRGSQLLTSHDNPLHPAGDGFWGSPIYCVGRALPEYAFNTPQIAVTVDYSRTCIAGNDLTFDVRTDNDTYRYGTYNSQPPTGYQINGGSTHDFIFWINSQAGSIFIKTIQNPDECGHACDYRIDSITINRPLVNHDYGNLRPQEIRYTADYTHDVWECGTNPPRCIGLTGSAEWWITSFDGRSLGNSVIKWTFNDPDLLPTTATIRYPHQEGYANEFGSNIFTNAYGNHLSVNPLLVEAYAVGCEDTEEGHEPLRLSVPVGTCRPAASPNSKISEAEVISDDQIILSPNPTSKSANITLPVGRQKALITLLDSKGRFVLRTNANGKTTTLSTATLPSGTYTVKIIEPGGTVTSKKLVVVK